MVCTYIYYLLENTVEKLMPSIITTEQVVAFAIAYGVTADDLNDQGHQLQLVLEGAASLENYPTSKEILELAPPKSTYGEWVRKVYAA